MIKSQIRTLAYSFAWLTAATAATASEQESTKNLSLTLKFDCLVYYHSYTNLYYDNFMDTKISSDELYFYPIKGDKIKLTISQKLTQGIMTPYQASYTINASKKDYVSTPNYWTYDYDRKFGKNIFTGVSEDSNYWSWLRPVDGKGYIAEFYDLKVINYPKYFTMTGTNGYFDHNILYFRKESSDRWKGLFSSWSHEDAGHIKLDCLIDETEVSYEKWMYKSQSWFEELPHKENRKP